MEATLIVDASAVEGENITRTHCLSIFLTVRFPRALTPTDGKDVWRSPVPVLRCGSCPRITRSVTSSLAQAVGRNLGSTRDVNKTRLLVTGSLMVRNGNQPKQRTLVGGGALIKDR